MGGDPILELGHGRHLAEVDRGARLVIFFGAAERAERRKARARDGRININQAAAARQTEDGEVFTKALVLEELEHRRVEAHRLDLDHPSIQVDVGRAHRPHAPAPSDQAGLVELQAQVAPYRNLRLCALLVKIKVVASPLSKALQALTIEVAVERNRERRQKLGRRKRDGHGIDIAKRPSERGGEVRKHGYAWAYGRIRLGSSPCQ